MRSISAALDIAQREGAPPAIMVRFDDRPPVAQRIAPSGYNITGQANRPHGVSSALLPNPPWHDCFYRVYVDTNGVLWGAVDPLLGVAVQMTQLATGVKTADQPCAVANDGDTLQVFWVHADNYTIYTRRSADRGQSWGSQVQVNSHGQGSIRAIAATFTGAEFICAWLHDGLGGDPDDRLCIKKSSDGLNWTSQYTHAARWYASNGLAIDCDRNDPNRICYALITSVYEWNGQVEIATFVPATGAFAGPFSIMPHTNGGGFLYKWPSMLIRRDDFPLCLYTWLECRTAPPSYNRPVVAWTPRPGTVGMLMPFPATCADAPLCLARSSLQHFLAGSQYAFQWPRWAGSPTQTSQDLGEHLVAFVLREYEGRRGSLRLEFDDEGRRFADAGVDGTPLAMIRRGANILLGLGRQTPEGPAYAYQHHWWVTHVERSCPRGGRAAGTARLIVHATNAEGWMHDCYAPYSIAKHALTRREHLEWLLSFTCPNLALPADARLANTMAKVLVNVAEPFAALRDLLLEEGGYLVRYESVQSPDFTATTGLTARVKGYDYLDELAGAPRIGGPDGTPVLDLQTGQLPPGPNHVEVTGWDGASATFGEDWLFADIQDNYRHWATKHANLNIASDSEAADVASRILLRHKHNRRRTEVRIPYDTRLEVGDLVAISDPHAQLEGLPHYVRGLHGRFDTLRGLYDLTVTAHAAE